MSVNLSVIVPVYNVEKYLDKCLGSLVNQTLDNYEIIVVNDGTKDETLEELADVLEVLKSIAELENVKLEDVIEIAKQKRLKRGGFDKRIFLERTMTK